jgi:hypothetical protein
MMKFIGNVNEYIDPYLLKHLEKSTGDTVPVWQPDRWSGHPMLEEAKERARWGYSNRNHDFQQFNERSKDLLNYNFKLPPIPNDDRKTLWWFVKLLPGQMQAMHFDPHLLETSNPKRYTVFLQDYIPGHIFVWDDKMISNYKAGDMFEWTDPMCYHGCVNIGYETRYTLQLTTLDS